MSSQIGALIQFVNGEKADADEVNGNFSTIKAKHNATDSRLSDLENSTGGFLASTGTVISENLQKYKKIAITGATNATPIVIESANHGYSSDDNIYIAEIEGNTAANGAWTVTKNNDNYFSLNGSTGNGAYTTGGVGFLLANSPENLASKKDIEVSINAISNDPFIMKPQCVNSLNSDTTTQSIFTVSAGSLTNATIKSGTEFNIVRDGYAHEYKLVEDINIGTLTASTANYIALQVNEDALTKSELTNNDVTVNILTDGMLWKEVPSGLSAVNRLYFNGRNVYIDTPSGYTTADPVSAIALGELITDGSGVTSEVTYAFNRYFLSTGQTLSGAAGQSFTFVHNLGIKPHVDRVNHYLECVIAQGGYIVGDKTKPDTWSSGDSTPVGKYGITTKQAQVKLGNSAPISMMNVTNGGTLSVINANWRMCIEIDLP